MDKLWGDGAQLVSAFRAAHELHSAVHMAPDCIAFNAVDDPGLSLILDFSPKCEICARTYLQVGELFKRITGKPPVTLIRGQFTTRNDRNPPNPRPTVGPTTSTTNPRRAKAPYRRRVHNP